MDEEATGAHQQVAEDPIDVGTRRDLARSMTIVCFGALLAGGRSGALDPFAGGHRPVIDLWATVGTIVLLVGLVQLPVAHLPAGLRARRNAIIIAVALASAATAPYLPDGSLAGVGGLASWLWMLLLIDFVRRLLAHLGAPPLARRWGQVMAAWVIVGGASIGLSAVVAVTGSWSGDGHGWRVFSPPPVSHPNRWWILGAIVVLWIATSALLVALVVLALRTVRWLQMSAEPEDPDVVVLWDATRAPAGQGGELGPRRAGAALAPTTATTRPTSGRPAPVAPDRGTAESATDDDSAGGSPP